jgi:hypothetical protein
MEAEEGKELSGLKPLPSFPYSMPHPFFTNLKPFSPVSVRPFLFLKQK